MLDLQAGLAVHAVRGERQRYQPLRSQLCAGSAPLTVADSLLRHSGARCLYVADLDAIVRGQPQLDCLAELLAGLPALDALWLDAGFADAASALRLCDALADRMQRRAPQRVQPPRVRPVFGSESLRSLDGLPGADSGRGWPADGLLSLDRRGAQRLDPLALWQRPQDWPREVIVMTLECVGAGQGPALDALRELQALHAMQAPHAGHDARSRPQTNATHAQNPPPRRWIGAGGVRDAADLQLAAQAGAHAWLVASALHDGRLGAVTGLAAGTA